MVSNWWSAVKRIFVEIKYQLLYYLLGGRAQLDDYIYFWANKTDIVDKTGEVAVITGGARGIGFQVVRMLLQCNMHVVLESAVMNNATIGLSLLRCLAAVE